MSATERRGLRRGGDSIGKGIGEDPGGLPVRWPRGLLAAIWLLLAGYNVAVNTVINPATGGWGLESRWWLPLAVAWLLLTACLIVVDAWGEKSRLTPPLVVAWLLMAGYLAVVNAWRSIMPGNPAADPAGSGLRLNLYLLTFGVVAATLGGILNPRWTRRVVLLLAVLPIPLLLATSRNLPAGLAVLAVLAPTLGWGRVLAARLLDLRDPLDAWALGGAFGLGLIAALGFALGVVGLLRPPILWPLLLVLTLALPLRAGRLLRADLAAFGAWTRQPVALRPSSVAHLVLAGVAVAYLWLSLTGALAPEIREDAVTQRLAAAARFAREGRLTTDDPDLLAARAPAVGEVAYAVALAAGPLQAAKLLSWLVALLCAAAVFALGRRLGGPQAGGVAAFAFATMPIVFQLAQNALLDLFTTLFGVTAVLAVLSRERLDWRTALAAAVPLGLGVGVKEHFAYVAVGAAVALGIVALRPGSLMRAARLLALLGALSLLAAAPWLARSYAATGQIPGLELAVRSLTRTAGERPTVLGDLTVFGYGRAPANLVRAPFDITLRSINFGGLPGNGGALGYLWLALAPLLVVARPRRATVATLAGAGVAFLLWFYTAQHLRYGLPIFALLCAIGGAAYGAAWQRLRGGAARTALSLLLLVPAVAGVGVQMQAPNLSFPVALGREDAETYLTKYLLCCGNYGILRLLDAEPQATRAFTPVEYARLYTRVRLSSPAITGAALNVEADDAELLARLDEGGYSHVIVDRRFPAPNWDRITVFGEEFLRRNTLLVGSSGNAYLYRLLPSGQRGGQHPWARGSELLPNGDFEAARGGAPLGWNVGGKPIYDTAGRESYHGRGAVRGTPLDVLTAPAKVTPNGRYLLSHATRSVGGYGAARLQINWQNSAGQAVGLGLEVVPVSPRGYHTHSILVTAPPDAVTATVYVQAQDGEVWFDDVSLRAMQADERAAWRAGPPATRDADGPRGATLGGARVVGRAGAREGR